MGHTHRNDNALVPEHPAGLMRWFVNMNGRTTGPLEEQDLAHMVREGLVAGKAYIRDETGGAWLTLEKSPFRRHLSGAKGAASREPSLAPESSSKSGYTVPPAGPLDLDDLFDHPMKLDGPASEPPPRPMKSASRSAKQAAPEPVEPPEEKSGLFGRDEIDIDSMIDSVLDQSMPPPAPSPSRKQPSGPPIFDSGFDASAPSLPPAFGGSAPSVPPEQELDFESALDRMAGNAPAAAEPALGAKSLLEAETRSAPAPAPQGRDSDEFDLEKLELSAEASLAPPPPVPQQEASEPLAPEVEAAAVEATAETAPSKPGRKLSKRLAAGVAIVLLLGGGGLFGTKLLGEYRERERLALARAEAEAREAELNKAREAEQARLAAQSLSKIGVWSQEVETAKGTTDPALIPPQLERVETILREATALNIQLGSQSPAELSRVMTEASTVKTRLGNAQKARDAVATSMTWLRDIQKASVTINLSQIPEETERVKRIASEAAALSKELGEQTPIELASVTPAADTALELIENTRQILEALAASDKELERAEKLADDRNWLEADAAYASALEKLEKAPQLDSGRDGRVPPELDVAAAKARVVGGREHIAASVTKERKRIELEKQQREREAEIERKAAAYRARCGNAPTVSPFDGQLFGLVDAIRKKSRTDPGRFKIDHCTDPAMTTTDCWVSTCEVEGKIFAGAFRKKFAYSQREGFWEL